MGTGGERQDDEGDDDAAGDRGAVGMAGAAGAEAIEQALNAQTFVELVAALNAPVD